MNWQNQAGLACSPLSHRAAKVSEVSLKVSPPPWFPMRQSPEFLYRSMSFNKRSILASM